MATSTTSTAPTNATDAQFRAWGLAISTALAAMGLVQTADTGQINWATVLAPAGSGVSQGYEIWRLNDALQATAPFFFKFEYGAAAGGVALNPGIWVTTGIGSNGAGTLTAASTRTAFGANANSVTTFTCFFSGATNRFSMILWHSQGTGNIFLAFERSHAADGSDTGEYLSLAGAGAGATTAFYWTHLAPGTVIAEPANNIPGTCTTLVNTQMSGNIAIFPVTPVLGLARFPMRGIISGKYPEFTQGDNPSIQLYPGVTDAYIVLKTTSGSNTGASQFGPAGANNNNYVAIVRYN